MYSLLRLNAEGNQGRCLDGSSLGVHCCLLEGKHLDLQILFLHFCIPPQWQETNCFSFLFTCQCSHGGRIHSEFGALLSQINQPNSLSIANRIYGTKTITFHKVSPPGASEFHNIKLRESEESLWYSLQC